MTLQPSLSRFSLTFQFLLTIEQGGIKQTSQCIKCDKPHQLDICISDGPMASVFLCFFLREMSFSLLFQDYSRALDLMQIMILATDLASHFKISKSISSLTASKCSQYITIATLRQFLLSDEIVTNETNFRKRNIVFKYRRKQHINFLKGYQFSIYRIRKQKPAIFPSLFLRSFGRFVRAM